MTSSTLPLMLIVCGNGASWTMMLVFYTDSQLEFLAAVREPVRQVLKGPIGMHTQALIIYELTSPL